MTCGGALQRRRKQYLESFLEGLDGQLGQRDGSGKPTIIELPPADLSLKQHKQQYQPTKTVMCLLLVDPIEERGHRNNGRRDLATFGCRMLQGLLLSSAHIV